MEALVRSEMKLRLAIAAWICAALVVLVAGSRGPARAAAPAKVPAGQAAEPPLTEEEKQDAEIGRKAAAEIEKELKVLNNYSVTNIEQVVDQLRPVTEKPHQKYTLKVVDSKAVNAFSLPGGYLYFTKGLLGAVESPDELAAVTGHEMAHVCLSHHRRQMSRDARYMKILGPAILAAVLSRNSGVDPGAVAIIGSMVKMDALNHYGREAELESDQASVRYLYASKVYNPVAVLTVVEGLARMDEAGPEVEPGIAQTHPYGKERVEAVLKYLHELRVPIERPRVRKGIVATAGPVRKGGAEIGELRLDTYVVFQPAVEADGLSPVARAQRAAELLNPLLLQEIDVGDLSLLTRGDSALLQARNDAIFRITPADAAFHGTTVEQLSRQALKAIQSAFWAENTRRAY